MAAPPGDHVAVVIPALDEAGSIGGVLEAIAPESCGLPVEVIVVDDGSTDATPRSTRRCKRGLGCAYCGCGATAGRSPGTVKDRPIETYART